MRLENAERKSKGKVEKNVFGSYSNPELKKLYQIKCFFEKKNVSFIHLEITVPGLCIHIPLLFE